MEMAKGIWPGTAVSSAPSSYIRSNRIAIGSYGHSLARHGLSQRLQNDRPGQHQCANLDAGGGDWQEGGSTACICGESARRGGGLGEHTLSTLPATSD